MALKVQPPVSRIGLPLLQHSPCMVKMATLRPSIFTNGNKIGEKLKVTSMPIYYTNGIRRNAHYLLTPVGGSNIFGRFFRIIRSYANAIISYFEDPVKIMDQAVHEMNDELVKIRQATAQNLSSRKELEREFKYAERTSEYWFQKAQAALEKGNEDLAPEALTERKQFLNSANAFKAQLDQLNVVTDNLLSEYRMLESKIHEMKLKKDTLKARAAAAVTAAKVVDMFGNANGTSAISTFDRMEEKVLSMEYQSESLLQLTSNNLDEKC